jgi:hypothetical protein
LPSYFHVSTRLLEPDQIIEPGHWGTLTRQFGLPSAPAIQDGGNAVNLIWETALETARILCAPDSPSRLDCIFAFSSLSEAESFRNSHRQGAHVFEIQCSDEVRCHDGNYDAITTTPISISWLDFMPTSAIRYWSEAPTGKVEVLIGGPAKVVTRRA